MRILHYSVWYPSSKNPTYGIFIKRHIELTRKFADIKIVNNSINLIKNILTFRPDIIHFHVLRPRNTPEILNYIPYLIAWIFGIPYIITEHNTAWMRGYKANKLDKMAGYHAEAILPVSKCLQDAMKRAGLKCKSWIIVPNVISDIFKPLNYKPRHCGIQAIHVSTLREAQKRVSGILFAMNHLDNPELRLIIVGDGPDRAWLEDFTKRMDLNAYFVGKLSDDALVNNLQNSDFFILNSAEESFSVATAEALACGIPVVTSPCKGPEEFVNRKNGIISYNINLKTSIKFMIDDLKKEYYDRIEISKDIRSKFGEEAVTAKLKEVYDGIIN